jgi:hypothetical protein
MKIRNLTFTLFFILSSLFNSLYGQEYDWKTKDALGAPYSVVDSDLGTFKCKSDANSVTYCFYGEDNDYDCKSTVIVLNFTNSRVSRIMFIWTHNTSSEASADMNFEKNRLKRLYGRPEMRNGAAHFFTEGALISCGTHNSDQSYITFSPY